MITTDYTKPLRSPAKSRFTGAESRLSETDFTNYSHRAHRKHRGKKISSVNLCKSVSEKDRVHLCLIFGMVLLLSGLGNYAFGSCFITCAPCEETPNLPFCTFCIPTGNINCGHGCCSPSSCNNGTCCPPERPIGHGYAPCQDGWCPICCPSAEPEYCDGYGCYDSSTCERVCENGLVKDCGGDPDKVCCDNSCCDPSDCGEHYGPPIISVGFADGSPVVSSPGNPCPGVGFGSCGQAGPDGGPSIEVKISFQNCKWQFGATGKIAYCYGPSFNYTELDAAGIASIPESCRCSVVLSCVTATGCTECGGNLYARSSCVMQHESFHYAEYCRMLAEGEARLLNDPAFADMPCSQAPSCSDALSARQTAIEDAVSGVYEYAESICNETGAMDAARTCNLEVADEVSQYWLLTCSL